MSRIAALAALTSLLVACGACSKASDSTTRSRSADPLPQVVDKTKPGGTTGVPNPPPPPPGGKVGMTPENDASYKIAIAPPASAPVGSEAVARVSVTPSAGWHVNKDFPTSLAITAPDGVKVGKAMMDTKDVTKLDDNELAFDVKLVAAKAGTYKVDGEIKFAVCTPDSCDPKYRPIAIQLVVQ
jgi:hypothetical protein